MLAEQKSHVGFGGGRFRRVFATCRDTGSDRIGDWALRCHSEANADDHSRPVASHRDSASERAERRRRRSERCLNSGIGLLPLKKMSLVFGFVVLFAMLRDAIPFDPTALVHFL